MPPRMHGIYLDISANKTVSRAQFNVVVKEMISIYNRFIVAEAKAAGQSSDNITYIKNRNGARREEIIKEMYK